MAHIQLPEGLSGIRNPPVFSPAMREPIAARDKTMLRIVTQLTHGLPSVTAGDVDPARAAGWDEEALRVQGRQGYIREEHE